TDPLDPWSGWLVDADVEYGRGPSRVLPPGGFHSFTEDYARGLFDIRRYNRLGPSAQLNMRVVLGGWLDGGLLPLQRRVSVDGPGTIPGFGFRSTHAGFDRGNCNSHPGDNGTPAMCDRVALAQVEYRGDLKVDI